MISIISLFNRVIKRVKTDYFRKRYLATAKEIVSTPPALPGSMDFTLLSMVHQRDVFSYLVAAKSFIQFANPKRIVVVCDPSIGEADKAILLQQIPHLVLRHADEFTHADVPRGGTWERLYAISGYCAEDYVVQLDADTITCQKNSAVLNCISSKIGFSIGEIPNQKIQDFAETSRIGKEIIDMNLRNPPHIQASCEAIMAELGLPNEMRYVRGCAGFTGFPCDPLMRQKLINFSSVMTEKFGARWKEWGTEQVTSNYLVASCPGTVVLPFPDYCTPDVETESTVFLHFIGPMRFINNRYRNLTKIFIDSTSH